jgi:hypothetical protein
VQVDWNWCHACGFDPAGRKPAGWVPTEPLTPPPGMVPFDLLDEEPRRPPPPKSTFLESSPVTGHGAPPATVAPRPPRRKLAGSVASLGIIGLVVLLAIGVVVYVVEKGSSTAKAAPANPAFASGLPILFKLDSDVSDDSDQVPVMPTELAGCTQAKLSAGDVAAVSALQGPTDLGKLSLAIQIRTVRAARACDRVGVAQAASGQGEGLARFGANSIDQQVCLMEHYEDALANEDDSTAALVSDASIEAAVVPSFQACVPLVNGLQALLLSAEPQIPSTVANCMANAMAPSESWLQIFSTATSPDAGNLLQGSIASAGQSCGLGG